MSYRCEVCKKDQPRHAKPVRVVVSWKMEEKQVCPACARLLWKEKGNTPRRPTPTKKERKSND